MFLRAWSACLNHHYHPFVGYGRSEPGLVSGADPAARPIPVVGAGPGFFGHVLTLSDRISGTSSPCVRHDSIPETGVCEEAGDFPRGFTPCLLGA